MLLAKGQILSAVAGLAMLAIPVSAFAGHRHDNFRRAPIVAPHDRGFHNGWRNHPHAVPPPILPITRPIYHRPPTFVPGPRPVGWNNGWHENRWHEEEEAEHQWHPQNWQRWQRPAPAPNYGCDEDGDSCNRYGYGPQYSNYSNYGGQPYSWYMAPAPSSYNQSQQLNWLISRRQNAMGLIARMRAQGDSRGADRIVRTVVNPLTARINTLRNRMGYAYNTANYNYAPSGYAPSGYAAPANPLAGLLAGNPAYYGNQPNPALNVLGAAVAPMLGIQ